MSSMRRHKRRKEVVEIMRRHRKRQKFRIRIIRMIIRGLIIWNDFEKCTHIIIFSTNNKMFTIEK